MKLPKFLRPGFVGRIAQQPMRLPRLKPYVPRPEDPTIFWFNSERKDIVREVSDRITAKHSVDRRRMELVLNDAAYHEVRRLESQKDAESKEHLGYWRGLMRRIARMSDDEKRDALRDIVFRMANDVAGNFDPRVYQLSKHAVPRLLTGVMRPSSLPEVLPSGESESVIDRLLRVEGQVDLLKRLEKKGTLVYVPTHSSNLDSIVLGRALEVSGLSPCIYGAGKNLFTNPIISFFMHNLGAYRVDRRVTASVYKEVLKQYSQVMIERGYHSLFFPGGTRSRSNLLETHLKLGLAGSAVNAFCNNRVHGVDRDVWFVPTTINYELVLEAETLIEDWLKIEGKARYIIDDDEFSRVDRWVAFFRKVMGLEAACVIRFGTPVDPFGNPVDDDGRSIAPSGHTIDPGSYVLRAGKPVFDAERDAAYTKDLGDALVKRFREETVLMSTNLVAHVLWRRLVAATPNMDLFARLRVRGEVNVSRAELEAEVGALRDRLLELEAEGATRLNQSLHDDTAEELVTRALSVWDGYHTRQPAKNLGVDITADDPAMLLYYQNRLGPLAPDVVTEECHVEAAREIGTLGAVR